MAAGPDVFIRVAAAAASIVFVRDGLAALKGTRMLITKGYSTTIFDGWKARVLGIFLFAAAIVFLGVAWYGL